MSEHTEYRICGRRIDTGEEWQGIWHNLRPEHYGPRFKATMLNETRDLRKRNDNIAIEVRTVTYSDLTRHELDA